MLFLGISKKAGGERWRRGVPDDSFENGEFWHDIRVNERADTSSENRAHVPSCDTGDVIVQAKGGFDLRRCVR